MQKLLESQLFCTVLTTAIKENHGSSASGRPVAAFDLVSLSVNIHLINI